MICEECGKEFERNKRTPWQRYCSRKCTMRADWRRYYAAHREELKAKRRERYAAHKEEYSLAAKRWRWKHGK